MGETDEGEPYVAAADTLRENAEWAKAQVR